MAQAKVLSEQEFKRALAVVAKRRHHARDRLALLLTHWAGMRVCEVAPLTIDKVIGPAGEVLDEFRLDTDQTKGNRGRDRRGQIIGRRPISERPGHIEERRQIGHWEGDTVIGKGHKQAIVSLVERKSGYAVLAKVKNKTADLVSNAIIDRLKPLATKVKNLDL